MAIAIKKDVVLSRYGTLVERFSRENRTGIKLTCPEVTCRQGYLVYFDRETDEDEVRALFDQRAKQQHPFHPEVCAFDEPLPLLNFPAESGKEVPVARPAVIEKAPAQPHPPMRRYVPAGAPPSVRTSQVLFAAVKGLARCAALVVAAVPVLTKGSRPL